MNAITGIAGLSTALQRWTLVTLVFVIYSFVLALGSCQYGQHLEGQARDAQAHRDDIAQQQADADELQARGDLDRAITQSAAADDRVAQTAFTQLRIEVPHVVATIVESKTPARIAHPSDGPGSDLDTAVPLGDCRVSAGFVGVWNDALTAGLPGAAELDAGGAAAVDPADGRRR